MSDIPMDRRIALAKRYPEQFNIQYPRAAYCHEKFQRTDSTIEFLKESDLLLYLHIPFCEHRCAYCNFAVDIRPDARLHSAYVKALIRNIEQLDNFLPVETRIHGIDIGGGTPSLIDVDSLILLMQSLKPFIARSVVANPISIETSPRIAATDPLKMRAIRDSGVSRISMGVQSLTNDVICQMARKKEFGYDSTAMQNLREAGFNRINTDVMFGLPRQSEEDWLSDLQKVIDLNPDSITTYDCLYRSDDRQIVRSGRSVPSPEQVGRLYDLAYKRLLENGYMAPYGSENYSRHQGETGTSPYFEGRLLKHVPYIGLGNNASSQRASEWYFSPYGVDDWIEATGLLCENSVFVVGDGYKMPQQELMAKQVILSLQFGEIRKLEFTQRFGIQIEQVFPEALQHAVSQNWLRQESGKYTIVPNNFTNMPYLRSLFYTDDAISWLEESLSKKLS